MTEARQRLDFRESPHGTVAVLTVTIGGQSYVYESDPYSDSHIDQVASAFATLESDSVEGIFGSIWRGIKKGVKAIGKVAKTVATSDVFKKAAAGLAIIAPALGPLAPIALGVAGAAGVASKLASAATAHKSGAKRAAAKLVKSAHRDALRIARGNPHHAREILKAANVKRKNAEAVIAADRSPAQPPARSRLRSNHPGTVSARELARAKATGRILVGRPRRASGRVFWVAS